MPYEIFNASFALFQTPNAPAPNPIIGLLPYVAIFLIFYFFLIRPQMQARKKHVQMIDAVRRGDQVVTGGGLLGKVVKVLDNKDEVVIELADGVRVTAVKATLTDVRSKTQPAEKPEAQTEETPDTTN